MPTLTKEQIKQQEYLTNKYQGEFHEQILPLYESALHNIKQGLPSKDEISTLKEKGINFIEYVSDKENIPFDREVTSKNMDRSLEKMLEGQKTYKNHLSNPPQKNNSINNPFPEHAPLSPRDGYNSPDGDPLVKDMQQRLMAEGYAVGKHDVDGNLVLTLWKLLKNSKKKMALVQTEYLMPKTLKN